jgi:hypothetical protein
MFRYEFLPYRREGARLVLVMADPTDIPVVDELSLILQTPVQPAVGTPSAIQEALKRSQGTQRVLEQASESFKIQLLRDDEDGEEVLSIDKIQADQSPIIKLVDSTVFDALSRRASDIHIETRDSEVVIKYRIDGVLQPAMTIAKEHHSTVISRIKVMSSGHLQRPSARTMISVSWAARSTSASRSYPQCTKKTRSSASSTKRACRSSSPRSGSTCSGSTTKSSPGSGASSRSRTK